jgi:hypothetical protein
MRFQELSLSRLEIGIIGFAHSTKAFSFSMEAVEIFFHPFQLDLELSDLLVKFILQLVRFFTSRCGGWKIDQRLFPSDGAQPAEAYQPSIRFVIFPLFAQICSATSHL